MRRHLRRRGGGYEDQRLNDLALDTQRCLDSVLDLTVVKTTIVWRPPHNIRVPYFGGEDRAVAPDIVRCERGRNLTDPTVLVTPGGCSWEWASDGSVRVDSVAGLTTGQRYELTFSVIG